MRRVLVEKLDKRKEMMIAALWSNSGFEGQEGANARRTAIEELEEHYDSAATQILTGVMPQEEEIDSNNPFFAAGREGMKKILAPNRLEVSDALLADDEYKRMTLDQDG